MMPLGTTAVHHLFQQHLRCPPDATRMTVADPSSCARFLSCEAGSVKLEECPDGLHYIQRNRTCEWPMEGGSCADVFGRSYASTLLEECPDGLHYIQRNRTC